MDECISRFAQEQREACELYEVLLTLADSGLCDEDYLRGVGKLEDIAADKSLVPYLLARYHYTAENYNAADEWMKQALFYRPIEFTYWQFMLKICEKLGDKKRLYYFSTLLIDCGQNGGRLSVPLDDEEVLQIIGQASLNPTSVPFIKKIFYQDGKLLSDGDNLAGSYLDTADKGQYRRFCGVYNSRGWLNMRAYLASLLGDMHAVPHGYCEFPFDVMKCREERLVHMECPPGKACVLAIAAEKSYQRLNFTAEDITRHLEAGQWEFAFYRFEEGRTTIASESPFQIAEPVWLEHSPHRRKLVLNILADGLGWQVLKGQGYQAVPNIMKFFQEGVIFDNNFSVAEFTYPSLASIETGCYPYHTQIFNDNVPVHLPESFYTLSEQMKAKGYYCVNLMCDSAGMYNGVMRGFDRCVVNQITCHSYEAVNRCIEHLDAFRETDNYVFIHVSDSHPFNSNVQLAAHTQTALPWQERILEEYDNSVFKKKNTMNMTDNQYNIRQLDRNLGMLLAYVQEHYAEDEYVVNLYSDHGVSVYDSEPYLLSENQVGAALMMRGAGVPRLGLVEELTSVMDLYPLLGKVLGFAVPKYVDARLPKVMGGPGRQYAVSMSIFPGQTFKLCLRDSVYEFRLESAAQTEVSGRVNLSNFAAHIYRRNDRQEIMDKAIRERFMKEALRHMHSFVYFKEGEEAE